MGKVIEETTRSAKEGTIKKEVITEVYIAKKMMGITCRLLGLGWQDLGNVGIQVDNKYFSGFLTSSLSLVWIVNLVADLAVLLPILDRMSTQPDKWEIIHKNFFTV